MTDIVERLRAGNVTVVSKGVHVIDSAVLREAADEIERLRAALKPFSDIAQFVTDTQRDSRRKVCKNCNDPVDDGDGNFCGACREMGCKSE